MSVYWTRASHPELPDVVLPLDAMESYPEWEAVGEPTADDYALRAELERERATDAALAALAAEMGAPAPSFTPSTAIPDAPSPEPETSTPEPESPTPSGADPKEQ